MVAQRPGAGAGVVPGDAYALAGQVRFTQEPQRRHQRVRVQRFAPRGRTGLHQRAHAADDIRGAFGLFRTGQQGMAHGGAFFFVVQQASGGTGVRQDGGQGLIQFMGDAGGHFAQRAQARHRRQPRLLLLPARVGA